MTKANIWQWDETAANNADVAGIDISGATGKVKDGDNAMRAIMSAIITMEGKGSDVASASTLALGTERYYHVTGTTTITDIDFTDAVDGRWAWLIFDGALTLTHNSTTLKLPGNANIVTAAGDRALFIQDSSDNVICLVYQRAATNGSYTPTLTNTTNLDSSTASTTYYSVNNNIVHVFGTMTVDATSGASTATLLGVSLPVPSDLTDAGQLSGTGVINTSGASGRIAVQIRGDTTNNRAQFEWYSANVSAVGISFEFSYVIA